jgi:hypothetical protein
MFIHFIKKSNRIMKGFFKINQCLPWHFILLFIFTFSNLVNAQVSINNEGSLPDASAMLEVYSTDKGFLPPRMTTAQRNALSNPAEGLMIYNTDEACLEFWDGNWWHNPCGDNDYLQYPEEVVFCENGPASITEVSSAGEIWMDRNLGALQQAVASDDPDSYGSVYQWGRTGEGHQCRSTATSSTLASTAVPNAGNGWDGLFIIMGASPFDWLSTQDNNLWQGLGGTNNPCPAGFRIPTETEWENERISWSSNDPAGAFGSPLRLSLAGYRDYIDGAFDNQGTDGHYWSSTADGIFSRILLVTDGDAYIVNEYRGLGISVRCIKD